jgi:RNA recognition motif-containing protein
MGDQQGFQEQRGRGINHDDIAGKIFVGGLSWQTTESSLRYYFEKYGELTDAAILTDKRTGQPRYKCL